MKVKYIHVVVVVALVVLMVTMYFGVQVGEFIFRDFEPRVLREEPYRKSIRGERA